MADEGRLIIWSYMKGKNKDQRPQTQMLHWQELSISYKLECEQEWNTAEVGLRENIQIKLEYSSPTITTFR